MGCSGSKEVDSGGTGDPTRHRRRHRCAAQGDVAQAGASPLTPPRGGCEESSSNGTLSAEDEDEDDDDDDVDDDDAAAATPNVAFFVDPDDAGKPRTATPSPARTPPAPTGRSPGHERSLSLPRQQRRRRRRAKHRHGDGPAAADSPLCESVSGADSRSNTRSRSRRLASSRRAARGTSQSRSPSCSPQDDSNMQRGGRRKEHMRRRSPRKPGANNDGDSIAHAVDAVGHDGDHTAASKKHASWSPTRSPTTTTTNTTGTTTTTTRTTATTTSSGEAPATFCGTHSTITPSSGSRGSNGNGGSSSGGVAAAAAQSLTLSSTITGIGALHEDTRSAGDATATGRGGGGGAVDTDSCPSLLASERERAHLRGAEGNAIPTSQAAHGGFELRSIFTSGNDQSAIGAPVPGAFSAAVRGRDASGGGGGGDPAGRSLLPLNPLAGPAECGARPRPRCHSGQTTSGDGHEGATSPAAAATPGKADSEDEDEAASASRPSAICAFGSASDLQGGAADDDEADGNARGWLANNGFPLTIGALAAKIAPPNGMPLGLPQQSQSQSTNAAHVGSGSCWIGGGSTTTAAEKEAKATITIDASSQQLKKQQQLAKEEEQEDDVLQPRKKRLPSLLSATGSWSATFSRSSSSRSSTRSGSGSSQGSAFTLSGAAGETATRGAPPPPPGPGGSPAPPSGVPLANSISGAKVQYASRRRPSTIANPPCLTIAGSHRNELIYWLRGGLIHERSATSATSPQQAPPHLQHEPQAALSPHGEHAGPATMVEHRLLPIEQRRALRKAEIRDGTYTGRAHLFINLLEPTFRLRSLGAIPFFLDPSSFAKKDEGAAASPSMNNNNTTSSSVFSMSGSFQAGRRDTLNDSLLISRSSTSLSHLQPLLSEDARRLLRHLTNGDGDAFVAMVEGKQWSAVQQAAASLRQHTLMVGLVQLACVFYQCELYAYDSGVLEAKMLACTGPKDADAVISEMRAVTLGLYPRVAAAAAATSETSNPAHARGQLLTVPPRRSGVSDGGVRTMSIRDMVANPTAGEGAASAAAAAAAERARGEGWSQLNDLLHDLEFTCLYCARVAVWGLVRKEVASLEPEVI